mmetsp:Transcript_18191/g.32608  ORF Transcript_18191/g.32608 Transcript_18191/m.32608 type:complete len:109 (+) Transcript_18191:507-833(+)
MLKHFITNSTCLLAITLMMKSLAYFQFFLEYAFNGGKVFESLEGMELNLAVQLLLLELFTDIVPKVLLMHLIEDMSDVEQDLAVLPPSLVSLDAADGFSISRFRMLHF